MKSLKDLLENYIKSVEVKMEAYEQLCKALDEDANNDAKLFEEIEEYINRLRIDFNTAEIDDRR